MCRRCSECENYSHHWIPEPPTEGGADFGCKHCNAVGDECQECYGDGIDPNDHLLPQISGDPNRCPNCDGEGVVLVAGGDVVYSRG